MVRINPIPVMGNRSQAAKKTALPDDGKNWIAGGGKSISGGEEKWCKADPRTVSTARQLEPGFSTAYRAHTSTSTSITPFH